MVGPTYIFTAYRQSQLNCHARTIQPHESALRKRACHSTRYVALERSNRSRVPDRQDNRRHASARQSRRQPCAIRRLFCSNHLQSADAQVKETMREPIPACPASTRYSHSNGVRTPTWMWYEILRPPQMRQEWAVIFLVGFAFAVIFGNVKRQRPGVGAIVEHGSKRDDTAHIVVFCDAQRLPAVFLPTIIWLGGDLSEKMQRGGDCNVIERGLWPDDSFTTLYRANHRTGYLIVVETLIVDMMHLL